MLSFGNSLIQGFLGQLPNQVTCMRDERQLSPLYDHSNLATMFCTNTTMRTKNSTATR